MTRIGGVVVGIALGVSPAAHAGDGVNELGGSREGPVVDALGRQGGISFERANVFIELGMNVRCLASPETDRGIARTITPVPRTSEDTVALSYFERIGIRVGPLYLAVDAELGTGMTARDPEVSREVRVGGYGVVGVGGSLGFGSLAFEVAGGGRMVEETSSRLLREWGEGAVEARGRAALELSPWVALGVVGGTSLINRGEWMTGVFLSFDVFVRGSTR
jgi:hypothetical protein